MGGNARKLPHPPRLPCLPLPCSLRLPSLSLSPSLLSFLVWLCRLPVRILVPLSLSPSPPANGGTWTRHDGLDAPFSMSPLSTRGTYPEMNPLSVISPRGSPNHVVDG
ncbi:hypothetical protein LX36DRAFT_657377 [Colletotrichum falcatum]|nr:hypothetical protein LX36DRAFT_657377 [Colletotrichum falcatum]